MVTELGIHYGSRLPFLVNYLSDPRVKTLVNIRLGGANFQDPVSQIAKSNILYAAFRGSQSAIGQEMGHLRQKWGDEKKAKAKKQGSYYWGGDEDDVDRILANFATTKLYVASNHLDLLRVSIVAQLIILEMIVYLTNLGVVTTGCLPNFRAYYIDNCLLALDQLAPEPAQHIPQSMESPPGSADMSNQAPVHFIRRLKDELRGLLSLDNPKTS